MGGTTSDSATHSPGHRIWHRGTRRGDGAAEGGHRLRCLRAAPRLCRRDREFLTLATNGVDALRTLDAENSATSAGFPTTATVLWSGTGKPLGAAEVSMTLEDGITGYTLKRTDLYRVIRDAAENRGIQIEYGKRLIAAHHVDGGVRASFGDGSDVTADIMIGCDGIHSTVRGIIDPERPRRRMRDSSTWEALSEGCRSRPTLVEYHMIFGKRAFFGYALTPDGEVWWFANVPRPDEPARGSLAHIGTDEWRRRLIGLFADDTARRSASSRPPRTN